MQKLADFLKSTILKYGISSILSFLVDYGVFALVLQLGQSILVSTYIARACSCVVNFALNRNGVFRSCGHPLRQFLQYILLVILSSTVSGLAVTFLTAHLPLPTIVLKFCVECVLFFANYLIQKKLIFHDKK
ncbi:MAG: GtrA family protein [Firmicutes bacterium]|nr:GtrA family protein [Bacillota bacterium]